MMHFTFTSSFSLSAKIIDNKDTKVNVVELKVQY